MSNAPAPLGVFISYSHRDEDYKDDLVIHLANLKRQGKIRAWQDRDIEAGAEWDAEIKQQLESAEVILLMVTPRFLASDYCFDLEMQRAVERHNEGTARVVPIIVKPCDWQDTPFSKLQVVPKDAKPITKWDDQDEAFLNVVQGIRRTVESLQAKKPRGATATSNPSSVAPIPPPQFSTYNPATFTGREAETATLTDRLQAGCRIVAIAGMTGIGKTALAERVIANLNDTQLPYTRFSLDDRSLTPDFASSGAALLRELGEEPTLDDQKDPTNLLTHILHRLNNHPCRVQIDSLERLLRGNDQDGWSEFCDPLWLNLLQKFLSSTHCLSQLLLTTQDIPENLDTLGYRTPQFWHCEPLQGLSADEQQSLFQKLGLPQDVDSADYLSRIGEFYDGHPLVLQVIADEIRQPPFRSNVPLYWQHYEADFNATIPTQKLARSRLFRRRVRQQVEQTIQRLPESARQMLCGSAVFRRPVLVEFWLAMLPDGDAETAFTTIQDRHLIECAPMPSGCGRSRTTPFLVKQHNLIRSIAYDLLRADTAAWQSAERQAAQLWLNDYEPAPDAPNLETVRGYLEAFDHYCEMGDWESCKVILLNQQIGHRLQTWGYYQEMIRLCTRIIEKLENHSRLNCTQVLASAYLLSNKYHQSTSLFQDMLNLAIDLDDSYSEARAWLGLGHVYQSLTNQKQAISCFEQCLVIARNNNDIRNESAALGCLGECFIALNEYSLANDYLEQSLKIVRQDHDRRAEASVLSNLGRIKTRLGEHHKALELYQHHLAISREQEHSRGQWISLNDLGKTYCALNQHKLSIDCFEEALAICREIGNRQVEGATLNNLGNMHTTLGQFEKAIICYQQFLTIAQEIGERKDEGAALDNLGNAYDKLVQYEQAINYHQQFLRIAREIGDRRGEGIALVNLGATKLKLQVYPESLTNNQAALEIFQEIGDRANESEALKNLAELHQALGEVEVARQYGQQALALATKLGIPLKAECEALLAELNEG